MSEQDPLGFGKFVPGFDFLQNLAKGAGQAHPADAQSGQLGGAHAQRRGAGKAHRGAQGRALLAGPELQGPGRHGAGAGGAEDDAGHAQGHELQHGRRGQCPQAQGRRHHDGRGAEGHRDGGRRGRHRLGRGAGRARAQDGRRGSRRQRGRSPAMVGCADPAVPADRGRCAQGRHAQHGRRHRPQHGHRHGARRRPGRPATRCAPPCRARARRLPARLRAPRQGRQGAARKRSTTR